MAEKKRKKSLPQLLLLLLLLLTTTFSPSASAASPDDASAMQSLARSLSPLPAGWSADPSSDPCGQKPRWSGVSCSSDRVSVLNLKSLNLIGTLPPDLNKLSALQSLSFQYNKLAGPLPSFANMASLQEIYINDNSFSSVPPKAFAGLTGLTSLSLDRNTFAAWPIPDELAQSANLVSFSAMKANITGEIPAFLGSMANLQLLRLSYNSLVGGIPDSFRGSSVRELDLNNQYTKLSGRLDAIGSMTQLVTAMMQSNNFTGPIPDVSNCTSLTTLLLRDNGLTGVVPPSLSALSTLANLTLANNLLQGPLPDISSSVWRDSTESGNSFCSSKPGPCDPRVASLLKVAEGFGYPESLANAWQGNDPCNRWLFVVCDPQGKITVLNFASQRFGGTISPAIADIDSLKSVILSNNNLVGSIPDALTKIPQLQTLDVSNNNLTGNVPAFSTSVKFIYSGNPLFGKDLSNGGGTVDTNGNAEAAGSGPTRQHSLVWIAAVIVSVLLAAGIVCSVIYQRRKHLREFKKVRTQSPPPNGIIGIQLLNSNGASQGDLYSQASGSGDVSMLESDARMMPIQALRQATENFSEANILGRGGFGVVYKGRQPDGTLIAVKRMECGEMGKKGMEEFQAELAVLTKVRHRHLVALLGYCVEGYERLLVFEYMPQGTLGQHLFDGIETGYSPLTWKQRLTIALDVARGIEYLHNLAQKSFIHRDLKPSNVLLDNDMRAKVSDFGLVKLAPDGQYSVETRLAGTFGYLAPEYATTGRVTTKVDVYAFGVILMELMSGRKALDESLSEENTHLVPWFRRVLTNNGDLRKVVDPTLSLDEEDMKSVRMVSELAGYCTAREAHQRPDMGHAVNALAPLVDQWKPCSYDDDDNLNMSFNNSLSQRLQRWQDDAGTSMVSFGLDSHVERNDTTETSISSMPQTLPHVR